MPSRTLEELHPSPLMIACICLLGVRSYPFIRESWINNNFPGYDLTGKETWNIFARIDEEHPDWILELGCAGANNRIAKTVYRMLEAGFFGNQPRVSGLATDMDRGPLAFLEEVLSKYENDVLVTFGVDDKD